MITNLKPYSAMRASGVRWLGDVPEHWVVDPIARLGSLFKGSGGSKEDEVEEGVPCVRYGDLYTRHEFFIQETKAYVTPERAAHYTPIRFGDVLFAASGETIEDIGRSAVNLMEADACCGGDVLVFRPRANMDARFLGYAADSPASRHQKACMGRGFTVAHIYGSELKRLALPVPPLPEQTAIVRFLDYADRRIRRYIRAKQKLIKLLEEQKQAIIHRAVTRGLDPDVPLKDSGVEWLGDVPEHWEVRQLRRVLAFVTSGSRGWSAYYRDSGDIFIQSGNLGRTMSLDFSHVQHVQPPAGTEGERTRVKRNDILVCITGALTGNIVLVDGELAAPAYVNQHVALLRTKSGAVSPRYLAYTLHSEVGRVQFKTSEYGGTKQGLGLNDLRSAVAPLPPIEEQRRICACLDASLHRLTTASTAATHEISLLRELRTRLIADVVTGKLDVREVAARLPDEEAAVDEDGDLREDDPAFEDAELEAELEEIGT